MIQPASTASESTAKMYNEFYAIVGYPDIAQPVEHYPDDPYGRMMDNDFAWASANRDKILAEWTRRYDAKTVEK